HSLRSFSFEPFESWKFIKQKRLLFVEQPFLVLEVPSGLLVRAVMRAIPRELPFAALIQFRTVRIREVHQTKKVDLCRTTFLNIRGPERITRPRRSLRDPSPTSIRCAHSVSNRSNPGTSSNKKG